MSEKHTFKIALCAIVAIGVLLFALPARSSQDCLYIYVKFCKSDSCVEKYLEVEDGVNEIQCTYGAMGTAVKWGQENMPLYTPKEWKCTRKRLQDT